MSGSLEVKKIGDVPFKSPVFHIGQAKRTVLIITDTPMSDDYTEQPPLKHFIGDKRFETFKNVLNHAITTAKQHKQEVDCKVIFTCVTNQKDDGNLKNKLYNLIDEVKPDAVVAASLPVGHALFDNTPAKWYGRLRKHRIKLGKNKVKFKAMYSVAVQGWTDPKPGMKGDDGGAYISLIGQALFHYVTAMTGWHPCTINPPANDNIKYVTIDTMEKFKEFYAKLVKANIVSIDSEGTSLGVITSKLLTMQFFLADDKKPNRIGKDQLYFLPIYHREATWTRDEINKIIRMLKHYFEHGKSRYHIYANGKYDLEQWMSNLGVRWYNHRMYDVQGGEYLHDENIKNAKMVGDNYRPYALDCIEQRMGYFRSGLQISKSDRSNMASKLLKDIGDYGMIDVITPYLIHLQQLQWAKRRGYTKYLENCIDQVGNTFIMFSRMENQGNGVNIPYLTELQMENSVLNKALTDLNNWYKTSPAAQAVNDGLLDGQQYASNGLFGKVEKPWLFDINETAHRESLFYEQLKLQPLRYGSNDKGSMDKEFQQHYGHIPEVKTYGELTALKTAVNMFSTGLYSRLISDPDSIADGKIRSRYELLRVSTGRTSSLNPNLQNQPSRGKWAKVIKKIFEAGKGKILLKPDYSAHEVRGLGNISLDPVITKAFEAARAVIIALRVCDPKDIDKYTKIWQTQSDIHIQNVKLFFNQVVDGDHFLRYAIKAVVFGVMYGKGKGSLAIDLFKGVRARGKIKAERKEIEREILEIKKALKKAA